MISRRAMFIKTLYLAVSTLLSRFFGLIREFLMIRFLGSGVAADAFVAAFAIPNSLRKIFAEGALNAAFLPTLVSVMRSKGKAEVNALVTLMLITVQSALLLLCLGASYYADWVVWFAAPGFTGEQVIYAVSLVRILIFFILCVSSTAILTAALQVMHHFEVPANSQIVLNIFFIAELAACIYYNLSLTSLAYMILGNGIILVAMHWIAYRQVGLSLGLPSRQTWHELIKVAQKFLPCLITVGSIEISLIIDRQMASYLPTGSVALLYYTHGLLRLPLSVFAIAFSTTLLPHVTKVATYAPQRLRYYLFESTKLVLWFSIPVVLLMTVFSYKMFYTMMLSETFPLSSVELASHLLIAFACGLFFFSFNKIIINLFYALHDTVTPTIISLIGAVCNTILNYIFMHVWGVLGIVIATTVAAALQSILFMYMLRKRYSIRMYWQRLGTFLSKCCMQVLIFSILLYLCYAAVYFTIVHRAGSWAPFLLEGKGFWLWVSPLCALMGILVYVTRKKFDIRICFVD